MSRCVNINSTPVRSHLADQKIVDCWFLAEDAFVRAQIDEALAIEREREKEKVEFGIR